MFASLFDSHEIKDDFIEQFIEEWFIELEEDELDNWNEAFENDDQEFIEMLDGEFNESVVEKFFEIVWKHDIVPSEKFLDEDGEVADDYKNVVVGLYDKYHNNRPKK